MEKGARLRSNTPCTRRPRNSQTPANSTSRWST